VALGGTTVGASKYFKVDLFDSYRAGYAAVAAARPSTDRTYDTTACDVAVRAAYPTEVATGLDCSPRVRPTSTCVSRCASRLPARALSEGA